MALRKPYRFAAVACLGLSSAVGAADLFAVKPAAVAADADQQLADAVAGKVGQAGNLNGYRVEVTCMAGSVELTGAVRDQSQKDEVSKLVRSVKGVRKINNKLEIKSDIVKAQAESLPSPINNLIPGNVDIGSAGPMLSGDAPAAPVPVSPAAPGPISGSVPGNSIPMQPGAMSMGSPEGYGGTDPTPIGVPPTAGLYDSMPPRMPPYAWPTYAPYNNYSRVGYPTEYPQQAFPFIGPFYPFPKVPLGYRAIKLEWEDGHWYYGRTSTKRDYWKVRYW